MKIPAFLKTKKGYASAIGIALAFAFGLGLYAFRGAIWAPKPQPVEEQPAPVLAFRHPLTGAPLAEAMETLPQPYVVMIDHAADAWPQSGIEKAFLVIEAPVEAGIPRLEAFFTDDVTIEKIGPVRSARPYFIDWANEVDALYTHVGGSDAALEKIGRTGTFDLNEFSNGAAFWRAADRFAPHNAYTSTDRLAKVVATAKDKGKAPELLYGRWSFKDPAKDLEKTGKGVSLTFAAPAYSVRWEHQFETNRYARLQAGKPFKTASGDEIMADNIAVVITDMKVLDAVGRREVTTVGEGKGFVLQDGQAIEAIWKKPSATERLRFFREDGKEIEMNAGVTWIEVVPSEESVTVDAENTLGF